jgi:NCAIR mutase (PurE)-related protein
MMTLPACFILQIGFACPGQVAVISAGTADLPVAEEAALTLEIIGVKVERIYDAELQGFIGSLTKCQ